MDNVKPKLKSPVAAAFSKISNRVYFLLLVIAFVIRAY